MGINWALIKPTIQGQVSELSGLDINNVRWVDEPSGLVNGVLPVIWLRVSSIQSIGIDEERYDQNGTNDQTVTVCGQRTFTLSMRAESYTADLADPLFAGTIIENVKTRVLRSTSKFARSDAFGISNYIATKSFVYIEAGRPINTYVADFLCVCASNDIDTTENAGGFINEAIGTGTLDVGSINFDVKGS